MRRLPARLWKTMPRRLPPRVSRTHLQAQTPHRRPSVALTPSHVLHSSDRLVYSLATRRKGRTWATPQNNQNLHLANGTVTHTGWDHDADAGFDGEDVIIQLHLRSRPALQEIVRLCEPLVIVELCIRRDGGYVHGGRKLRHVLSPGLLVSRPGSRLRFYSGTA
jgi:hypothetical protein